SWPSHVSRGRTLDASTSPWTSRPTPESSIKPPPTSRLSRSRESRFSAFKRATRARSSSSAAEYPSFWTEPSSARSEQVPAPLNKTVLLQRRLSLDLITRHSRPMHFVRVASLPSEESAEAADIPRVRHQGPC